MILYTSFPDTSHSLLPYSNVTEIESSGNDGADSGIANSNKIGYNTGIIIVLLVIMGAVVVGMWFILTQRNSFVTYDTGSKSRSNEMSTENYETNEFNQDSNQPIWDATEQFHSQENPHFEGYENEFDYEALYNNFEETWG